MSVVAIKIENLKKSFDSTKAVADASFTVVEGQMFGLIGPDGAGKTTLMRILCGLLTFDAGQCSVFDFDVVAQLAEIRKIVGYMPQRFSLYPDLTVAENLRFFADLFEVDNAERKQRLNRLLDFSKLGPFQKRRANDLSGGMKQKLALSCTLIHTPRLLILDEPTTGVDPVSRREFWQILKDLLQQGVTILVSTPYMDEASKCDRIAFMHRGKILASDKPENMAQYFTHKLLEITSTDLHVTFKKLEMLPSIISAQLFGDKIHITVDDGAQTTQQLQQLNIGVTAINQIQPGIEDVFIELMKNWEEHERNFSSGS